MTLKKTVSIFSRQFKRAFNENKYQNYTDRRKFKLIYVLKNLK